MSLVDQQPALFSDLSDDALLFRSDDVRKRYTAEQAQAIEWKREAIIMLLGSDWPVEHIAERLHVNTRTVRAIAAQNAAEVAGATKLFARVCGGLAARWFGLAKTKEHEASFLQLVTAAGIATDKSVILESMGQISDVPDTKEAPDRLAVVSSLRRMMADQVDQAHQIEPGTELPSDAKPLITGTSDKNQAIDAPTDAPAHAEALPAVAAAGQASQGGGGGPDRLPASESPMGQPERGLQPKGPLPPEGAE